MAAGPDEDVVADFQRVEGHLAAAHAHGRADCAVCADDDGSVDLFSRCGEGDFYKSASYRPMVIAVEAVLSTVSLPSADRSTLR